MSYKNNISILVDYAHEPESMRLLLSTLRGLVQKGRYDKIIHIVSCDGAGRDDWKKPLLGKISFDLADFSIVTLDNYDENDDTQQIINLLTRDFDKKLKNIKFETTDKRSIAFDIALERAKFHALNNERVLICSTGVGVEAGLTQPYGKIDWNEKEIWKEKFNALK